MKLRSLTTLGLLVLIGQILLVSAQEPAELESMRFVNALRQRGDHDLARAYLERLKRSASPALAVEIPLEIAKVRLLEASLEPDSSKRQAMLQEAQREFDQFLAKHGKHPRAPEARLEKAQVLVQEGRILLSKSLSQDSLDAQRTEGARARAKLEEAGKALAAVAKEMAKQLEGKSQDGADRRRLEEGLLQAQLSVGQNLFDQAMTFSREDQARFKERGARVNQAQQELAKLAAGGDTSPHTWIARAWVGRCVHENGDPKNARAKLKEVIDAKQPAAVEARRQARYFLMLALQESEDLKDKVIQMEEAGKEWLRSYDRNYKNTPEGYGVRYLLSEIHLGRALAAKGKLIKDDELKKARALLNDVEHGDNEFSERARRKKLAVIKQQGGFDNKIQDLRTFDDCYVRAQYEMSLIAEDVKKAKTSEDQEKARLDRIGQVMAALDRGLNLPDARGKRSPDISTARAIQAFWSLNTKRYRDCIRFGEALTKDDPRASQTANAAMYALQAYSEMIAEHESILEKSTGDLKDDNGQKVDAPTYARTLTDDKQKMQAFAREVFKLWPREPAGDLARHQLALLLFRDKTDGEQRLKNFSEAIGLLSGITPAYAQYTRAQFLLALKAMEAEKENVPPLSAVAGQQPISWKKRALDAFAAIPEPSGEDPEANEMFLNARGLLGSELYKEKKYDQLEKLAAPLVDKLSAWRFKDEETRTRFRTQIAFLHYFAEYGQAEAAFTANDHARVLAILDPFVNEVKAARDHPIKTNQALGQAMLSMALRSSIQTNKLDQARACLDALQKINTDDAEALTTVLRQLLALINKQLEEAQHKGDKARREQLIKGYSALLNDLTKGAKLTPLFILSLAHCYSSMDMHPKAIDLLSKFPKPKPDDAEAEKLWKSCQLNLIRELRLNKEIKKARPLLDEVMGTKEKPGWGVRQIDARLEMIHLLIEEEKYSEAYGEASKLLKILLPRIDDNTYKAHYLDAYYLMVYAMYQFGQHAKDEARKERYTNEAAKQVMQLEARFMGFGDDATAQRFQALLAREAELKKAYDKIKAETPAGKK